MLEGVDEILSILFISLFHSKTSHNMSELIEQEVICVSKDQECGGFIVSLGAKHSLRSLLVNAPDWS